MREREGGREGGREAGREGGGEQVERRREGLGEVWGVRGSFPRFFVGTKYAFGSYVPPIPLLDVPNASQRTQDVPRCTGCASAATAVTGCNRLSPLSPAVTGCHRLSPLSPAVTGCHRLSPVASLQTAAARQNKMMPECPVAICKEPGRHCHVVHKSRFTGCNGYKVIHPMNERSVGQSSVCG